MQTNQHNQPDPLKVEEFMKRYGELVEEMKIDFIHFPLYAPDGNGGWRLTVHSQAVSTEKPQGMESPEEFIPRR